MSEGQIGSGEVTAEFKRAMRRLASTVTIISTADVNGNRYGISALKKSALSRAALAGS